jgi:hypothetical protein
VERATPGAPGTTLQQAARTERGFLKIAGHRFFSLSSIGWRGGPGRGGAFLFGIPLSSVLSPLVPRGERKKNTEF